MLKRAKRAVFAAVLFVLFCTALYAGEDPGAAPPMKNGYTLLSDMEIVTMSAESALYHLREYTIPQPPKDKDNKIESKDIPPDNLYTPIHAEALGASGEHANPVPPTPVPPTPPTPPAPPKPSPHITSARAAMLKIIRCRMHTQDHDELAILYNDPSGTLLRIHDYKEDRDYGPYSIPLVDNDSHTKWDGCASDLNGDGSDEVVVASGNPVYGSSAEIKVVVVDKNEKQFSHTIDAPDDFGPFNVVAGDFNGDGREEILVVTISRGDATYHLWFLTFDGSGIKEEATEKVPSGAGFKDLSWVQAILAEDIDYDGDLELILSNRKWLMFIVNFNNDFSVESIKKEDASHLNNLCLQESDKLTFSHVVMDSGDVDGDGRRELFVSRIFNMNGKGCFYLKGFKFNSDGSYSTYFRLGMNTEGASRPFLMVANIDGREDPNKPNFSDELIWGITGTSQNDCYYTMLIEKFTPDAEVIHYAANKFPLVGCSIGKADIPIQVAPVDMDGDSVILGQPLHYIIEGHLDYTAVLQEPPKHIDFIKGTDGKWKVINISRVMGVPGITETFYAEFKDQRGRALTVEDKSITDYNFSVGVKSETEFGFKFLGTEVESKIKASFKYTYEHNKDTWNRNYSETEIASDVKAMDDDSLIYKSQTIHIWLYPILGKSQHEAKNGQRGQLFIEISRPGPFTKKTMFGRNVEWYQPVHENGNLLSYPWSPDQLDGYDEDNLKANPMTIDLGGGENELEVVWKNASENGTELSWTHKIAADLSMGFKAKILAVEEKLEVEGSYDEAWTHLNSTITETTATRGITIHTCPVEEDYSYAFTPYIYTHKKLGCLMVSYTANPSYGASSQWWQEGSGYGSNPDLALNLPWRWVAHREGEDKWVFEFNEDEMERKKSKSIFYLDENGEPFGYTVKEGKRITVKARIYNYSFVDTPKDKPVTVRFEYQLGENKRAYDQKLKRWVYKMVWSKRTKLADVDIAPIPGYQNPNGEPNWRWAETSFDTTGKGGYYIRFWVTVDPENRITEIYGHDNGEKYSNNEGYSCIPLAVVSQEQQEAPPEAIPGPPRVVVSSITASKKTAREGEIITVEAVVKALGKDFKHVPVFFYDDIDGPERPFDVELIPHLRRGESYLITVKYNTSGKSGPIRIHADAEGNIASTEILVSPAYSGWKGELLKELKKH